MSASVDVSDSLDEARTRLLHTARALLGAWAAVCCAMAALVVGSVVALVVAATLHPVYVVIWSALAVASAYNLTRFWPRRTAAVGPVLSRRRRRDLQAWVDPERLLDWPDVVRLSARPEVELSEGELVLGLPLLACLDRVELRALVEVAVVQAEVEDVRTVRWALRVAHGDVGRPMPGRRVRAHWPTSPLTHTLRQRAAALDADLGNWAGACERTLVGTSRTIATATAGRDQVVEAWSLFRTEWLQPAAARGRRHVAPFTGLRHFVEGAEAAGWLAHPRPWWPPTGPLAELVARYEEQVAVGLDRRGRDLVPVTWAEHPAEVTLPHWRALVSEVLDTARRSTRDDAVTLESVLHLMESTASTAEPFAEKMVTRVLHAAVCVAAVDSGRYRPAWAWPGGTRLEGEDGWVLPVDSIVGEVLEMVRLGRGLPRAYAELRTALTQLGIDPHEPLWLDHDDELRAARPIGSFVARQQLAPRLVVLTDRSLHVFRDPAGPRLGQLLRPHTPRDATAALRRRMLTVWQGETTDQTLAVDAADVRRARIGPATGGLWWRLTLDCVDRTVVLRGRGDGVPEADELARWLGREPERTWQHTSPALLRLRHGLGLVGTVLGTLAVLAGVALTAVAPAGAPEALAPALATGGFAALVLAVLPDALVELGRRGRPPGFGAPVSD